MTLGRYIPLCTFMHLSYNMNVIYMLAVIHVFLFVQMLFPQVLFLSFEVTQSFCFIFWGSLLVLVSILLHLDVLK